MLTKFLDEIKNIRKGYPVMENEVFDLNDKVDSIEKK